MGRTYISNVFFHTQSVGQPRGLVGLQLLKSAELLAISFDLLRFQKRPFAFGDNWNTIHIELKVFLFNILQIVPDQLFDFLKVASRVLRIVLVPGQCRSVFIRICRPIN